MDNWWLKTEHFSINDCNSQISQRISTPAFMEIQSYYSLIRQPQPPHACFLPRCITATVLPALTLNVGIGGAIWDAESPNEANHNSEGWRLAGSGVCMKHFQGWSRSASVKIIKTRRCNIWQIIFAYKLSVKCRNETPSPLNSTNSCGQQPRHFRSDHQLIVADVSRCNNVR